MHGHWPRVGTVILTIDFLMIAALAWGQGDVKSMETTQPAAKGPAPIRTTMEALHASGGVPKGWKFLMPNGDPAKGREVFVTMRLLCRVGEGEELQDYKRDHKPGPELTGMGSHHPAEYFAESIVNPNRVIIQGAGYTGSDGLSKMPTYGETMTVQQLVDVVTYLKTLKGDMGGMHGTGGMKHDDTSQPMKHHDMK